MLTIVNFFPLIIGALPRVKIRANMGTHIDVAIITVCHRIHHWSVCHTRQNFGWESVKGFSVASWGATQNLSLCGLDLFFFFN